jgi:hypothetical protein
MTPPPAASPAAHPVPRVMQPSSGLPPGGPPLAGRPAPGPAPPPCGCTAAGRPRCAYVLRANAPRSTIDVPLPLPSWHPSPRSTTSSRLPAPKGSARVSLRGPNTSGAPISTLARSRATGGTAAVQPLDKSGPRQGGSRPGAAASGAAVAAPAASRPAECAAATGGSSRLGAADGGAHALASERQCCRCASTIADMYASAAGPGLSYARPGPVIPHAQTYHSIARRFLSSSRGRSSASADRPHDRARAMHNRAHTAACACPPDTFAGRRGGGDGAAHGRRRRPPSGTRCRRRAAAARRRWRCGPWTAGARPPPPCPASPPAPAAAARARRCPRARAGLRAGLGLGLNPMAPRRIVPITTATSLPASPPAPAAAARARRCPRARAGLRARFRVRRIPTAGRAGSAAARRDLQACGGCAKSRARPRAETLRGRGRLAWGLLTCRACAPPRRACCGRRRAGRGSAGGGTPATQPTLSCGSPVHQPHASSRAPCPQHTRAGSWRAFRRRRRARPAALAGRAAGPEVRQQQHAARHQRRAHHAACRAPRRPPQLARARASEPAGGREQSR